MLQLEIVTPAGTALSAHVDAVVAPGAQGELQVLPQHLPLLTILGSGALRYQDAKGGGEVLVRGGVLEVSAEGRVLVLTDEVQLPGALDKARAQRLKDETLKGFEQDYLTDVRLAQLHQDLRFAEAVLAR
ncbi:MAG: ATP synthase F1 subunit epsilon [Deltaproteobacteria bacterium]|nr:ATP synthase F1 subunit epsilon [Deltaproteobacteria bacterium]